MEKWRSEFDALLVERFKAQKRKNARLSLRAFAKKVGLSPGSLSELLNGSSRWQISPERAVAVTKLLGLTPVRENRMLALIGHEFEREREDVALSDESLLRDWTIFPIAMAFDLPVKERGIAAIARRLRLNPVRVEEVVDFLLDRGVLKREKGGVISREGGFWDVSGATETAFRHFHRQNLQLAAKALAEVPKEERDFTALTFVGDKSQLEAVRREIRRFQDKIVSLMGSDSTNEVYRLAINFFPINFAARKVLR